MEDAIALAFLGPEKDLKALENHPALAPGKRIRVESGTETWFDTPKGSLGAAGFALSVAPSGTRLRQTLRRTDRDGIAPGWRVEGWSGYLPTEDPMPAALSEAWEDCDLDPDRVIDGPLSPSLRTETTQRTRRIETGGASLLARWSECKAKAGGKTRVFRWFSLELEQGPLAPLYETARALIDESNLRPSPESPLEILLDWATGRTRQWSKSPKPLMSAEATVEESLIHAARHCMNHLLANETPTLDDDHPEGIHQMRVALRRLRSALKVFKKALPPEQATRVEAEVKWLTNSMGPARDLDVFVTEVAAPLANHRTDDPDLDLLMGRAAEQRLKARAAARRAIRSKRYAQLVLDLGVWLSRRDWRFEEIDPEDAEAMAAGAARSVLQSTPLIELSGRLLGKRHKVVKRDGKRFHALVIEERHQLRIDVKKLRYALDFFASLYDGKTTKPFLESLARLQDDLGYLNDVAVAEDLVRRLAEGTKGDEALACARAGGMVVGWHERGMAEVEGKLSADVAEFVSRKPFWKGR